MTDKKTTQQVKKDYIALRDYVFQDANGNHKVTITKGEAGEKIIKKLLSVRPVNKYPQDKWIASSIAHLVANRIIKDASDNSK